MFATDFNGRRIAEGSSVALVHGPWDGPQGTVQEVQDGRCWVTFPDAEKLNGWYLGRHLV